MAKTNINKKRLVVSYHNLPAEIQEEVKKLYPYGYTEHMIRIDKPSGDFFYAVPYETDEISYLVKITVKIDEQVEEEEEKDYYDDDEIKGADELPTDDEEDDM